MEAGVTDSEPFLAMAGVRVTAAGAERATVLQPASPELENHVGVRHASALHAAGYAAARALAAAATAAAGAEAELRLQCSEIAYKAMGLGELEAVAEADGEWGGELERLRAGETAPLRCAVSIRNEEGRAVAELTVEWLAVPAG